MDFYPLAVPVDFLFQAAFAAAAATIVSGAVAERTKFVGYLSYSVIITALIYPIVVSWKWGGGWLDELGFIDFAGSGLVHMTGGFAALVGAMVIGPRIGKFAPDGTPRALPGHSIPLAMAGVLLLFIGWFGFNPGSQLQADMAVPIIGVLTAFAAGSGGAAAMATSWLTMKRPDVSMAGNGVLAGLVAICSGIGEMDLARYGAHRVPLPVSSWSSRCSGSSASASTIRSGPSRSTACADSGDCSQPGLFATTSPINGATESAGLFYGGGVRPVHRSAHRRRSDRGVRGGMAAGILFSVLKAIDALRVSPEEESAGLDITEHGSPGLRSRHPRHLNDRSDDSV